jgi:ligand-binding SRPBCC domain-containing protein
MRVAELNRTIELPCPRCEVFAFFADPGNLELLTPPWLRFGILSPQPITMAEGTEIDYRLRLHGVPLRWRSRITAWQPEYRFVDEQIRGPYRLWIHEHTFEEIDGGTRVGDHVRYAVPGGVVVERLLVATDLGRIFDFRHAQLLERFGR